MVIKRIKIEFKELRRKIFLFNNILIVCVGNICRSPMAQAVFRHTLLQKNYKDCSVFSAGINALVGHKADEKAIQLMLSRGLDISEHRASQLNTQMIRKANLILAMELSHKIDIENNEPSAKGKVFRLGEWGGYDIPDPYKLDLAAFESVLAQIDIGINEWINKIYK